MGSPLPLFGTRFSLFQFNLSPNHWAWFAETHTHEVNVLPPWAQTYEHSQTHGAGIIGCKQTRIFSNYTLIKHTKHEYILLFKSRTIQIQLKFPLATCNPGPFPLHGGGYGSQFYILPSVVNM